jgi:hypothetical protein
MIPRILILLTLVIGLLSAATVRAQDTATPDGPVTCTLEPRSLDEIAAIQASPVAATPTASAGGDPVDEETLAEIALALRVAEACALAGDYERLAGAYSEAAIAAGAFDPEAVAIVPGTPVATPSGTEPGKYGSAVVVAAAQIDETHVLVEIERGPTVRELRMVFEDGRWLIDSAETVIDTIVTDGAATPDGSAVLPIEVLQAVVDLVALETGDEVTTVTIVAAEAVEWPDAFLGCPVEGSFAAQVITAGYRVTVQLEGKQLEIHTDLRGHAVTC